MKKLLIIALLTLLASPILAQTTPPKVQPTATNPTADELLKSITDCNAKKDYACVVQLSSKGIELYPTTEIFYSERGSGFFHLDKYDEAIADETTALAINPNDVDAFISRGYDYYFQNRYDPALADYDKAIELNPKIYRVYYYRGLAYAEKPEPNNELAIAEFGRAIQIKPDLKDAYLERAGLNFKKMEDWAAAEKDYTQAIKLGENTVEVYINRGAANFYLKNYEQSVADNKKVLELEPTNTVAKRNLENSLTYQKQPPGVKQTIPNPTADDLLKSINDSRAQKNYSSERNIANIGVELYPNNEKFRIYRNCFRFVGNRIVIFRRIIFL